VERGVRRDRGPAVTRLGGLGHALNRGLQPDVIRRTAADHRLQAGELQRPARRVQVTHVVDGEPDDFEPAVQ
jgi:hypothetical protein